ncbi:MAG: glutamate 5-kinase [Mobiluncus sp.]|uniref:Glutamate 5-kinase n=1 Tax=Mobiluncus porci TaxID=2652278 RepID=A0A7K0K214_9ACTO|nr:glutamate 5-kinase [Mobiluncus sp.]MCI6584878.1 glutamate 5-kinase [Mobiluncus sp.]MST49459.1 glutamate 5-kinase [Mobiluncus porci]
MTTVVKIGSSSLTRPDGFLDLNRIDEVSRLLAEEVKHGEHVVLVSSGAISAGSQPLGRTERPKDLATAQAVAAVGQGLLMYRWTQALAWQGVVAAQILLSAAEVVGRAQYNNACRALEKLEALGVIPVINENDAVATDEVRFGDNDRLAAIVAHMVKAERLILCTDVDGLFTAHPSNPEALRIAEVRGLEDLEGIDIGQVGSRWGTGGMRTKLLAAQVAASNGTEVTLTSTNLLGEALAGEKVGTVFRVTGKRRGLKQLWLAYAATAQGRLVLDDGAAKAITVGKKSLLAAGVTAVEGAFEAGEVVELTDQSGEIIAKGVSAYSSAQVKAIISGNQTDLAKSGLTDLGPVVHRDYLAETRY